MIRIRPDVYDRLSRHVLSTVPEEACGFLAAPRWDLERITKIAPVLNVAEDAVNTYEVDERTQLDTWAFLDDAGMKAIITYHSHVNAPPKMSPKDVALAGDTKMLHLIVSVTPGQGIVETGMWRVEWAAGKSEIVPIEWKISA